MVSTNKIIIDANTWLRFIIHGKQHKLVDIIETYKLKVFADNYLLSEIFDTCIENEWYTKAQAHQIIENIRLVIVGTTTNAIYRFNPDPKDNYLFDLAIQNNCDL
jgi:predicted nucleic acid-binding protein